MKIQVLGPGCVTCKQLTANEQKAVGGAIVEVNPCSHGT